jgi:hypothetical protein
MADLLGRYASVIEGRLTCWDRVVIAGMLPELVHKDGVYNYMRRYGVEVRDLEDHFKALNLKIRSAAEEIAARNGLQIDYIHKPNFRKDEQIKAIVRERGDHPGLVHVFSVVEACTAWRVGQRNSDGGQFIYTRHAKCLHYYFYFIDPDFGLCYFRVATFAPFRLQFYFNGHAWLASCLRRAGMNCELIDNVIVNVDDWVRAQELATSLDVETLHAQLDSLADRCVPFMDRFLSTYQWSTWQAEIATDIVFRSTEELAPVYDHLVRVAASSVKADQIAYFLGRRPDGRFPHEVGTRFETRVQGTCVKHNMGKASIKMYDKLGRVLRIETTASDVTFFTHRREVEHRDGTRSVKTAKVRKSIYNLPLLATIMTGSNERYLAFISALDDPSDGVRRLDTLAATVKKKGRGWKGFNLCAAVDHATLVALARGEWALHGICNRSLRELLGITARQASSLLRRLRLHSILRKAPLAYRYYLTKAGQQILAAALRVRTEILIPALSTHHRQDLTPF